jgi:hypothetical protein
MQAKCFAPVCEPWKQTIRKIRPSLRPFALQSRLVSTVALPREIQSGESALGFDGELK